MDEKQYYEWARQRVKDDNYPKVVYKYFRFTEECYVEDMISKNRLWFSSPSKFNDPYDCNIKIRTNSTIEDRKIYIDNLIDKTNLSRLEKRKLKLHFLNDPKKFENWLNERFKEFTKLMGVCCFSSASDINHLWSFYANSHTGICFGFDIEEDLDFFNVFIKVTYGDYPEYNIIEAQKVPDSIHHKILGTKSLDWEKEKEFRIIKNKGETYYRFNRNCLTKVIFGAKMDIKKRNDIIEVIDKNYSDVLYYKGVLKENDFGLEIQQL